MVLAMLAWAACLGAALTHIWVDLRSRGLVQLLPAGTREFLLETRLVDYLRDSSMGQKLAKYVPFVFGMTDAEVADYLARAPARFRERLLRPGMVGELPAGVQSLLLPASTSVTSVPLHQEGKGGQGVDPALHPLSQLSATEAAQPPNSTLGKAATPMPITGNTGGAVAPSAAVATGGRTPGPLRFGAPSSSVSAAVLDDGVGGAGAGAGAGAPGVAR